MKIALVYFLVTDFMETGQNSTNTKLHKVTKLHEGTKLDEATKLQEDELAQRVNFARKVIFAKKKYYYEKIKLKYKLIKKKVTDRG